MSKTFPIAYPGQLSPEAASTVHHLSGGLRRAVIAAVAMVIAMAVLIMFVPIGGAVIGSGQISVQSRVKRVSHPAGGVIENIYVEDGDIVSIGQRLLAFEDKVSSADAELSRLSVTQLLALRARLEAERTSRDSLLMPAAYSEIQSPEARQIFVAEREIFRVRQRKFQSEIAQLNAQILQLHEQIGGYEAEIIAIAKQQELIGPELEGIRSLWERGLVTLARKNQLERTVIQLEGENAALLASIARTRIQIEETREKIVQISLTRKIDADETIANINNILNQQQARSISAQDIQEKSEVRATASGLVYNLAFSVAGETVQPGETILEIVPGDDRLVITGRISPADIDQVRTGQAARVRFSSQSVSSTPEFRGVVSFVAPEVTTDTERGLSFYAVRIDLEPRGVSKNRRLELKPGMPAVIFVETGDRSILSYLTKPIMDQIALAFRDNQ